MLTSGQIAALCYADIFNFPLTKEELVKFAINTSTNKNSDAYIQQKDGFFFLKGRSALVQIRKKRQAYSLEKLAHAEKVIKYLRLISSIQLIAVTGSLAMENSEKNDDIDLLLISKPGLVWTTRFCAVVLVELMGKRRRPNHTTSSNKICLNMFLDEDHLGVPQKEQDIFSAHEVAQVKILWSRGAVEKKFWKKNEWIKKYLPYFKFKPSNFQTNSHNQTSHFLEHILRWFQLHYMNSKRTTEVISDGYLRFHPHDARNWVIPEYKKRLAIVGLK